MTEPKDEELVTSEGKWSEGYKKHLREHEDKKRFRSKAIKGTFMGCQSSDDYDEIHIQVQDPVIEKYPISMMPAVAIFQSHNLKRGDTIGFKLDERGWTDLESLKVLERAPDQRQERKRYLSYRHQKNIIQRAAIYNETLGWYKEYIGLKIIKNRKKPRRIRWLPVKKGTKGGIWIPGPGFISRKYITPEKFEELKASGKIVIERPPNL